ncbi:amidase [Polynucleobacter sp. TUM22923]|uniref:amidase n=1 Tax=Polynucleobacter sp. TUM22923 TaxID=3022126 RepID=UPI0025735C87|nr:amidase [Polynucleobacter sp. TUM22923]BDX21442.1 amidase [Polynucleobacter sp. TUM22923]
MIKTTLGLVEAAQGIDSGLIAAEDYLSECVTRADALEPTLRAFTVRATLEQMISETKSGPLMGIPLTGIPLKGIPVAVKDIMATEDFITSYGSPIYRDYIPKEDASVIKKIRALGGVVFGKTVTTEFAWRNPGPTTNPWNSLHTPGGSSSGSAAAVAAGIVPLALGSQTVGSIIRPAAFCGVVGFKPSFGAVSLDGVHPVAHSLDHLGFFTRSVQDAAYAFHLLKDDDDHQGQSIAQPYISPNRTMQSQHLDDQAPRIAILETPFDDQLSKEQYDLLGTTSTLLRAAGATLEKLTLPQTYWDGIDALHIMMAYEAAMVHEEHLRNYPDLVGADIRELVTKGKGYTDSEYAATQNLQQALRLSIEEIFNQYDVILSAPATGEAPKGLSNTGNPIFCALWSFIGTPAITLPISRSLNGLPLGIQLIGNYRGDEKLLQVAAFAEAALKNDMQQNSYSTQTGY